MKLLDRLPDGAILGLAVACFVLAGMSFVVFVFAVAKLFGH